VEEAVDRMLEYEVRFLEAVEVDTRSEFLKALWLKPLPAVAARCTAD